ncbi:hypothetical protein [Thermoanaerobacterium sp. RBIITD]|uniref:hypothetical protein n=1 Tax=Thermoanaerobacterium sp. RBIITD TaxID=1550240 RepID=UPI000BB87E6A|nr:hypothetical protein [Thermoanaerobacterium sp. RBIITD]SNX52609.1 hypothetical protein SAMN05660242_0013 [Thermoanaerobacterium sp. RBIITD]
MFQKIISFLLVLALLSVLSLSSVFASTAISKDLTSNYESLQKSILNKNFDVSKMTVAERKYYDSVVQAALIKSGGKSFNTTENIKIVEDILADKDNQNEPERTISGYVTTSGYSMATSGSSIHHIISVGTAGAIFNAVIWVVLSFYGGGSVEACIRTLIAKYGYNEARSIIEQQVVSKIVNTLIRWGMEKSLVLSLTYNITTTIIQAAIDPGDAIANYIDSRDAAPNNGWIDVAY